MKVVVAGKIIRILLLVVVVSLTGCQSAADTARNKLGPKKDSNAKLKFKAKYGTNECTPIRLERGKLILAGAAQRSSSSNNNFMMKLSVKTTASKSAEKVPNPSLSALGLLGVKVSGYRNKNDASESTFAAGIGPLAKKVDMRIINDVLYVKRSGTWYKMGSAGGLMLDIGRELFLHGSLVQVTAANRCTDGYIEVIGKVAGDDVVAQAKTEPTGLVSSALQYTTGLRFKAVIRNRQLESDVIFAGLRIPESTNIPFPIGSVSLTFAEKYTPAPFRKIPVPKTSTPIESQGAFSEMLGLPAGQSAPSSATSTDAEVGHLLD